MHYSEIFNRLWLAYSNQNPTALNVFNLFRNEGEMVVNDHIAFRTFDDERVHIDKLSAIFIDAGYVQKGDYLFEEKKLTAKHFEHKTDKEAPRVFISQLVTKSFSNFLQETVTEILNQIHENILSGKELIFAGLPWKTPSFTVYNTLREESEYAAWLYAYGFRANHFTVSVNHLRKYNSIEKVNQLLKDNGFILNDSGGEVKGTAEQLLQQSSTRSEIISYSFVEGNFSIPACYYEFALRYKDINGDLYNGFIAKSADKIFESTNFYEKK